MTAEGNKKRTRSPAYPFIDLEEAIRYTRLAYEQEDRHPFTLEAAASHWDYKATSSAVNQIVSALKQFGLLIEDPANGIRRVRLSPLALDLMVHDGESDLQRRDLLKKAALNPKLHREIWDKYGGKLPSDTSLKIYLLREREVPFNKDQVDRFITQLRDSIRFANLAPDDKIPPAEGAADEAEEDGKERNEGREDEQPPPSRRRPMQPGTKEDTYTLDDGQVVIQWSERIGAEEIEDVESWMQIVIRKMKRAAQKADEPEED
jgi:hypothetical protein